MAPEKRPSAGRPLGVWCLAGSDTGRAAVPVAQNDSDDDTYHRGHRADGRCPDQYPFAMLQESTCLWFFRTLLGCQDQLSVEASSKLGIGLYRHQDRL